MMWFRRQVILHRNTYIGKKHIALEKYSNICGSPILWYGHSTPLPKYRTSMYRTLAHMRQRAQLKLQTRSTRFLWRLWYSTVGPHGSLKRLCNPHWSRKWLCNECMPHTTSVALSRQDLDNAPIVRSQLPTFSCLSDDILAPQGVSSYRRPK